MLCCEFGVGHESTHTHALGSCVAGTWSSQLCLYDNNIQLSHQDPCSRHMLVMSILTSAPMLLPTDSGEQLFTRMQCCQGSCVMWSAWVSKSTHAHSSGQPAAHSVGGWLLTGSGLQPSTWYYFTCTTYTASPMTTTLKLRYEKNAERMSTVLQTKRLLSIQASPFVLYSVVLMVLLSNALRDTASVLSISLPLSVSFSPLTIRESSRGHAHGLRRRKLVNSASWHATVEDTPHFHHHHRRHLPHGYWAPQVSLPARPPSFHSCLPPKSVSLRLPLSPHLDLIPSQTQVSSKWLVWRNLFWREVFPFMYTGKMHHQPLEMNAWVLVHGAQFCTRASVRALEPAGCWQLNAGLIYTGSDPGEYQAVCEIHACWAAKLSGSAAGFPPENPWLKYRWVN